MGETKKELTSFQRAVAIITVVVLMVYAAINVYLVVNAYSKLDGNINEFADVVANWQIGAISDLKVAKTCASGYEQAFNDRVWPGVSDGCYCPGSIPASTLNSKNITCNPFCSASCSADARSVGCQDVAGKEPQVLTNLGISVTDKVQICVKRSKDTWANTAVKSAGDCPSGTITCGTGENKFCSSDSVCPITSIMVDDLNASPAITALDITNCQATPATCQVLANLAPDRRRVRIVRGETNVLPLAEFTLNEYSMCKIKDEDNVTPGRPFFDLLKEKPKTCNTDGASRWNVSHSLTETNLFKSNGLDTYIGGLTAYDAPGMDGYYRTTVSGDTYSWRLFTRQYIPVKTTCRNRLENLVSKKKFIDDLKKAQLALLVIGILSSFVLGIVLAFMEFQNLRGVDLSCISGKGEEERTKLKRIKKWINYGFKGLQLPFQIWAIVITASAKALFLDLSDENCFNTDTNSVLSFLSTTLASTFQSNIIALAILAATLLLDLILDIWSRRKKKNETPTEIGNASLAQTHRGDESMKVHDLNETNPNSAIGFGKPPQMSHSQITPQPQSAQQPQSITIQLSAPPTQQYPQQQYPPQQYPPQQYPPQQYPPAQQYPPQQYPPQQYPPQQQQQYPPQGYQQQYPPRY